MEQAQKSLPIANIYVAQSNLILLVQRKYFPLVIIQSDFGLYEMSRLLMAQPLIV